MELVRRFEGLRHKAARLDSGGWTIGYGHTLSAREGAEVTPQEAEALLLFDLDRVARAVDALVFTPLNPNQFGALIAFAFNVGLDNFQRSEVLKRVNEGAYLRAALALELWRKAEFQGEDLVIDALVRRRTAEKALFLTPPEGFRPVPGAVLRPLFDPAAAELQAQAAGLDTPAEIEVTLDGDRALARRSTTVEAAARNVSERLERLFPDPEPEAKPPAEPEPAHTAEPEPPPAPEAEPPPLPVAEPIAAPGPPAAAPPPRAAGAPFGALSLDDLVDPGGDFGRRPAPVFGPAAPARATPEIEAARELGTLAVGVIGALMFVGALLVMIYGKATPASLIVGLAGVILMVPAGLRLLLKLFGDRPV